LADKVFPALNDESISAIASRFDVEVEVEPYSPDGLDVYPLTSGLPRTVL
jgi:hypothetical protein